MPAANFPAPSAPLVDDNGRITRAWLQFFQELSKGDRVHVTISPSNYTPDTSIAQAKVDGDLSAQLKGIDTQLASIPNSQLIEGVTLTAGTNNEIAHTLGTVPSSVVPESIDKPTVPYKSDTAWTSSNVYLYTDTTCTCNLRVYV